MKTLLIAAACIASLALDADRTFAQQTHRGFAAITVSDLAATEQWYQTHLGTRRLTASRAPSGAAQNVVIANDYFMLELIHFTSKAPSDTVLKDVRRIGLQKVGIWVTPTVFDSVFRHLSGLNATFLGGVFTDNALKARTFIVRDNAGVLLQYFAPLSSSDAGAVSNTGGGFLAFGREWRRRPR